MTFCETSTQETQQSPTESLTDFDKPAKREITRELPHKVRSWACLYPLWAGIAPPDRAHRVTGEHILNPREFLSDFGVRSPAGNERIYNDLPMGGPSNWQGPVWGMSTFLTAYGVARYGARTEALGIAQRTVILFASDLRRNDCLHEYYDAETGEPVIKPGFLRWNLLAVRILGDIRTGRDPGEP